MVTNNGGSPLTKKECIVSVLPVYCHCIVIVHPVCCQCVGRLLPDLTF